MNESQLKTLKFMNEVKSKVDMNEFAQTVGLTTSQTMDQLKALAKTGFVTKTSAGYGITEKGKNALKATIKLPPDEGFKFYIDLNQPTSTNARSIAEFNDAVKRIDVSSLEFHVYRGDFGNWFHALLNDIVFADELEVLKLKGLKGEPLREALTAALESRYSLQE